LIYVYYCHLDL